MKRNRSLPLLACVLAAMVALAAMNTATAQQQAPNCCSYTVLLHDLAGSCDQLSIPVYLKWECPQEVLTLTEYVGNGTYTETIGNPPLASCPPACKLTGISLDKVTFVSLGEGGPFNVEDCCYHLSTGVVNGCIVIKITRC